VVIGNGMILNYLQSPSGYYETHVEKWIDGGKD